MKKKIILSHIATLLVSFALMLSFVCLVLTGINRKNTETTIRSNLSLAEEVYQDKRKNESKENAINDCVLILKASKQDARFTFLDINGAVLFDNDVQTNTNHLNRPEIKNLDTIYYRHSDTLNINMVYLAHYIYGEALYIRIAMPLKLIDSLLVRISLISSLVMIFIVIIAFILDYFFINKELKPLQEGSAKLSRLVSLEPGNTTNEIESITKSINEAEKLIQEKVDDLTEEKEKLNYIINTMSQGLIILDSNENISLINLMAKEIFGTKNPKTLPQVTILPEIYELYHHSLKRKEENVLTEIDGKNYLVSTHSIENVWVGEGEVGCSLLFVDVSEEQRLETAKKDFFANASHELKSPLTSILGYTQMIKEGFLTEKNDIDDALLKIQSEGKRMNEIIIGMLELSRLESESTDGPKEECHLLEIVKEEVLPFENEAKKKNVDLEIEGDDFLVYALKEDVASLVKNLVENAIRYNVKNGKVSIHLSSQTRTFVISDTGIGIPKQDQVRVFERFYRVDKARSRKLGGTGLGLSIVKHICNNNSIQLKLESELGNGSTFTLTFPLKGTK